MRIRTTNAMEKSTTFPRTLEIGTTKRGKNTFLINAALPTRLLEDVVTLLATKAHGTNAAKLKISYGTPFDGILASRPKKSVKTTIFMNGWMTAHEAPSTVCL